MFFKNASLEYIVCKVSIEVSQDSHLFLACVVG